MLLDRGVVLGRRIAGAECHAVGDEISPADRWRRAAVAPIEAAMRDSSRSVFRGSRQHAVDWQQRVRRIEREPAESAAPELATPSSITPANRSTCPPAPLDLPDYCPLLRRTTGRHEARHWGRPAVRARRTSFARVIDWQAVSRCRGDIDVRRRRASSARRTLADFVRRRGECVFLQMMLRLRISARRSQSTMRADGCRVDLGRRGRTVRAVPARRMAAEAGHHRIAGREDTGRVLRRRGADQCGAARQQQRCPHDDRRPRHGGCCGSRRIGWHIVRNVADAPAPASA